MAQDVRTTALNGIKGQCGVSLQSLIVVRHAIRETLKEAGLSASRRKVLQAAADEAKAMVGGVKAVVTLAKIAETGHLPRSLARLVAET